MFCRRRLQGIARKLGDFERFRTHVFIIVKNSLAKETQIKQGGDWTQVFVIVINSLVKKTEENKGAPFRKDDGESKFQENGGLPETLVCCCPFLMILHRFWPAVWGSRSQPKAPEEILQQIVKKIKENERRFKELQGNWAISSDFGRTYLL